MITLFKYFVSFWKARRLFCCCSHRILFKVSYEKQEVKEGDSIEIVTLIQEDKNVEFVGKENKESVSLGTSGYPLLKL